MDAVNRSRDQNADKKWMKHTAFSKKNKVKAWIYAISPNLYFAVNAWMKRL